jgi:hypothetical protein
MSILPKLHQEKYAEEHKTVISYQLPVTNYPLPVSTINHILMQLIESYLIQLID